MFGLHHQIHTLKQNGSSIADYYHKLNALWKQIDAMIELPKCVCNASESFKKHNQLMKLMQFLMVLDDSYMQSRSSILSREVLPNVRSAYATISSEKSHRVASGSIVGSLLKESGFCLSLMQVGSSGLVCDNCGFNGHTIERCFKIIGYPADFRKRRANQHMTYTDEELDNVLDISHLKVKVGHPNGTEAFISKIRNLKLSNDLILYDVPTTTAHQPYDDERVDPNLNSDSKSQSDSSHFSVSGRDVNTADFPNNSGNDADSSEDIFATHNEKVTTLEDNIFSEDLPIDRKAIESKWIYKIKYRSSGEIDRYKIRLVAQGFSQKEWIDYEETFASVVKMVTIICLLNVAISKAWLVFQLDVNNAFLYDDLVETVYMKPPEGYFPSRNKVCRLKKSLFGLKQAPRQWNAKLTSTLIENGFSQSKSDYSLYTKFDKGIFLALLVYVDDIIITGNNISEIENFKIYLKSKFMIKDLGKLKYFLGIEVIETNKCICLNQRKHVLNLLSEYGLGIHIVKNSNKNLLAYSDADWAKCVVIRKLVTRYCVFLNNSLVSWKSKKQNTLSKSLTEAEYRALALVTSEVIWILKFLKDLEIDNLLPVTLHCDSNSAIKIAANPVFQERTKHLEIDLHFVREKLSKRCC
ncbi:ribonuclease H-like domain-containing protein [Tanacetum coccineum]